MIHVTVATIFGVPTVSNNIVYVINIVDIYIYVCVYLDLYFCTQFLHSAKEFVAT